MSAARGANCWFDGALIPGLLDAVSHRIHVPGIPASEISATLPDGGHAGGRTRSLRVAGGEIGSATMAGNGVIWFNRFVFERARFAGGRQGLFFFKLA